jgi:hypothetical protein
LAGVVRTAAVLLQDGASEVILVITEAAPRDQAVQFSAWGDVLPSVKLIAPKSRPPYRWVPFALYLRTLTAGKKTTAR